MKQLYSILFTSLFSTFLIAQDQAPAVELFFITEGAPSTPIITCTLTAQSQCWSILKPIPPQPGGYYLTDEYDNSVYVPTANNLGQLSAGFDFVTSGDPGIGYPDLAYGLYKLTISGSSKYFYLDYRDYRVGYYSYYNPPTYGHVIDLWIKYIYTQDRFYYTSDQGPIPYSEIANGQLLNIWDIKQKGTQQTSLFPDYWENCLAVIKSSNNHPLLVWGPYPPDGIITRPTNYQIWRKYGGLDWYQIDFVNSSTFNYEDDDLSITGQGSGTTVWYKLRTVQSALPNNLLSGFSNIASIVVDGEDPGKLSTGRTRNEIGKNNIELYPNYPNPFNPSTKISYSLPKDGLVTLKVFDILGNEVATLVNEHQSEGFHEVKFNASALTGGIYFYKLTSDNFTSTKKLIVLK